MLITIDGPAGVGKSTLAKQLAGKLNVPFFETGALYRTITFKALEEDIDLNDESAFQPLLHALKMETFVKDGSRVFLANGIDVTSKLRSEVVTQNVPLVSTYLSVRKKVESIQRKMSEKTDAVFEGRDMGSVVFPMADLKFFLTASAETRAKRRFDQMHSQIPYEKVLEEVKTRDNIDSTREHSPLIQPKDAIVIDTSNLSIDQVLHQMLSAFEKLFRKRTKGSLFYRFARSIVHFFIKVCYRYEVIGKENIPKTGGLIISNHTSFLDPILLGCAFRQCLHYFARDTLFRNPLFGFLLKKVSVHPIKRDTQSAAALRFAKNLILNGQTTLLFPEGKRSETGKMQPFKEGAAFLAASANGIIIPIYIQGAFDIWPKGRKFPKLFGKIRLYIGKPLNFSSYTHLKKKEALSAFSKDLEKQVQLLQKA